MNASVFVSKTYLVPKVIDSEKNKTVLLAGDYNLDLLNPNSHVPTGEFLNNMLAYNFFPTIRHPTRISDSSATLINNIFTNINQKKLTLSLFIAILQITFL